MSTLIVGIIVFGGIVLAGYKTYKAQKTGGTCSCGCSGCEKSTSFRKQ